MRLPKRLRGSDQRHADEVRVQDGWPITGPLQSMVERAVDGLF
jgi:hypothetical protein